MTAAASLIKPEDLAAFRANHKPVDPASAHLHMPPGAHLTPERAVRIPIKDWQRSYVAVTQALDAHLTEARTREDGTEIAAETLHRILGTIAYGMQLWNSPTANPRKVFRTSVDAQLQDLWDHMNRVMGEVVTAALDRINREAQEGFTHERAHLTHAADQAQRDATDARRLLDAASAQLTREREAHAHEAAQLRDQLTRERQAVIDRDRETRNRIQQLEHDLAEGRKVIAHLNAECQRLEDQLTAPPAPPTPQEAPMPESTPTPGPQNALETASLCAFLRGRHEKAYRWAGTALFSPETPTTPERVTDPNILTAWRNAYPTPASMQAQLRALVLPILGRAA